MWNQVVSRLPSEKRAAGIELHLNSSGVLDIALVILVKKNSNVLIEKAFAVTQNWADLINNLPKNIPCAITLTGKDIFHKPVQDIHLFEGSKIVNAILPTVDASAYYWQLYEGHKSPELCVVRRIILDALLTRLEAHKVNVQAVALGYFPLTDFIYAFGLEGRSLSLLSVDLSVSSGQLNVEATVDSGYRLQERSLKIALQEIQTVMLLAYCAALSVFIPGEKSSAGLMHPFIMHNNKERNYRNKCILLAGLLGFTLLLTLSINFAVFQYYFNKSTRATISTQASNKNNGEFDKVARLASSRELFFRDRGWFKGYRLSLIVALIGSSVPDSITLNSLTVFPVREEADGTVKNFHAAADTLLITGSSADSAPLRNWISSLSKIEFLKRIAVGRYQLNPATGKTEFGLTVLLK